MVSRVYRGRKLRGQSAMALPSSIVPSRVPLEPCESVSSKLAKREWSAPPQIYARSSLSFRRRLRHTSRATDLVIDIYCCLRTILTRCREKFEFSYPQDPHWYLNRSLSRQEERESTGACVRCLFRHFQASPCRQSRLCTSRRKFVRRAPRVWML